MLCDIYAMASHPVKKLKNQKVPGTLVPEVGPRDQCPEDAPRGPVVPHAKFGSPLSKTVGRNPGHTDRQTDRQTDRH